MPQAQILIVDYHNQWRRTLRSILEAIPSYQVVAEARDACEAIDKAAQLLPDIVLLDIGMPILNGIEAAPRICRASPKSKIIFVTQENDRDVRTAALASGAEGYVLKSNAAFEIRLAIDDALLNVQRGQARAFPLHECFAGG